MGPTTAKDLFVDPSVKNLGDPSVKHLDDPSLKESVHASVNHVDDPSDRVDLSMKELIIIVLLLPSNKTRSDAV